MKKKVINLSALLLALILVIPMQLLCVFAEETNPTDKIDETVLFYLKEIKDASERIPINISVVAPDLSGIDEQVVSKYGEYLTYDEYVEMYGEVDCYEYHQQHTIPREEYSEQLKKELFDKNNEAFMEEAGLNKENLVSEWVNVDDNVISIWLTEEEIYEVASYENVERISYCEINPDYPVLVYLIANGDVNGDDEISSMDAVMLQRYFVGLEKLSPEIIKWHADVNGDGELTSIDVLEIMRYLVGYQTDSNVGEIKDIPYQYYHLLEEW